MRKLSSAARHMAVLFTIDCNIPRNRTAFVLCKKNLLTFVEYIIYLCVIWYVMQYSFSADAQRQIG